LLKKSITYTDFDDNEVTETHYFHLSKADLIEMEVSKEGGMQAYIQRVIASEDGKQIIEVFKDLLQKSYGTRTEGGRFLRDSEKTAEFMASEAYSELLTEDSDGLEKTSADADVAYDGCCRGRKGRLRSRSFGFRCLSHDHDGS
jgi:hypothetical protein